MCCLAKSDPLILPPFTSTHPLLPPYPSLFLPPLCFIIKCNGVLGPHCVWCQASSSGKRCCDERLAPSSQRLASRWMTSLALTGSWRGVTALFTSCQDWWLWTFGRRTALCNVVSFLRPMTREDNVTVRRKPKLLLSVNWWSPGSVYECNHILREIIYQFASSSREQKHEISEDTQQPHNLVPECIR